jgi:hypothetical protein
MPVDPIHRRPRFALWVCLLALASTSALTVADTPDPKVSTPEALPRTQAPQAPVSASIKAVAPVPRDDSPIPEAGTIRPAPLEPRQPSAPTGLCDGS